MNFKDAFELGTAIVASLGGGGVLVFGLSGYLGKLWADRALESQKHEYSDLLQKAKSDLDRELNRYQVELDALGLSHKLRMTEEFSQLGQLWKRLAILRNAFNALVPQGVSFEPADPDARNQYKARLRTEFQKALSDAYQFFIENKLFFPVPVATDGETVLRCALKEDQAYNIFATESDSEQKRVYRKISFESLEAFNNGVEELYILMRRYIDGKNAG